MTTAVFLDRDGVINEKAAEGQYVTRWEDFHVLPGVAESIAELNSMGLLVVVVTNQRCVAKGLMTETQLSKLHQQMAEHLAGSGAKLDAIYYCPHDLEPPCDCRKPAPGMLLSAAQSYGVDLAASWMIGDSESDIQAGKNAGCKTVRLTANLGPGLSSAAAREAGADLVAASLPEAIQQIRQTSHS
jgi:D-glycero-D-manno-heptose 1,7-bisphosphate phosphatase